MHKIHSKENCKAFLRRKIKKNLHEWKKGKTYMSREMAIAVAYSQVREHGCKV